MLRRIYSSLLLSDKRTVDFQQLNISLHVKSVHLQIVPPPPNRSILVINHLMYHSFIIWKIAVLDNRQQMKQFTHGKWYLNVLYMEINLIEFNWRKSIFFLSVCFRSLVLWIFDTWRLCRQGRVNVQPHDFTVDFVFHFSAFFPKLRLFGQRQPMQVVDEWRRTEILLDVAFEIWIQHVGGGPPS